MTSCGRRAILIVLDGVGIGALPDAGNYGDATAATLQHVAEANTGLYLPNLERLGLGRLGWFAGVSAESPVCGAYGRMLERSAAKDSTTGHWELAGVILEEPFATYPEGFPDSLIKAFTDITGSAPLGNLAMSGTEVLEAYGAEHLNTGRLILYTSVDSVFQVASHEDLIPPQELYRICAEARNLADHYRIGRVIARPFVGDPTNGFRRTPRRKDFSMQPPAPTLLDKIEAAGLPVIGVGKIRDLFAGQGVAESYPTKDNLDGMARTVDCLNGLSQGLLMINLIDFDMLYGHRKDSTGFGRALEVFDAWLPKLLEQLQTEDLLIITADHGCDPLSPGTDHTREYVPVLAWSPGMTQAATPLGTRNSFSDVGATLAEYLRVAPTSSGESFLAELGMGGVNA